MAETAQPYIGKAIGLRNLTWFPLLTDEPGETPTFDTPIKMARAIAATITPTIRTAELESDDGIEDDIAQTSGYTLSIDASQINQEVRDIVFGHKGDEKGGVTYSDTDVAPWGALAFKTLLSTKDGSTKYAYHVFYRGRFQDFTESFETKRRGSLTFQTHTGIQGNFYPLESNGAIRYVVREDATGADAAVIGDWFTAPQFAPVIPEG